LRTIRDCGKKLTSDDANLSWCESYCFGRDWKKNAANAIMTPAFLCHDDCADWIRTSFAGAMTMSDSTVPKSGIQIYAMMNVLDEHSLWNHLVREPVRSNVRSIC
jgi:hypothetical protein